MPLKSANASAGAGGGSTHNTRRYEGGNPSGRRTAVPRVEITQKGTTVTEEDDRTETLPQKRHISDPRSSARRQQSGEDALQQRKPLSLSSTRTLNASSPAFIPYQYLEQEQCGNADDDVAASTHSVFSFSTTTSPLMHMDSTYGGSSLFSPLAFASSLNAGHPATTMSPTLPSSVANADLLPAGATFASIASNATGTSAPSAQSSHQLRGAYARATAAAAAATAAAAAAAAASALHTPHTDPCVSYAAATTSTVGAGTAAVPSHTHSEPQQCCATRKAAVTTPSSANAVYGPSVPVFYSQFIDIATGTTSMTPFALLQDQLDFDDADRLSEAFDGCRGEAEIPQGPAIILAAAAVPPSPLTLAVEREKTETQRVRQASYSASQRASQRRVSAITAAVLASQDAQLAERSQRHPESEHARDGRISATTAAALSANEASCTQHPANKDASDAATAKPTATGQHHTSASTMATASETGTTTHETPKRRPSTVSTATVGTGNSNKERMPVTPSIDGAASVTKRLHACLASTGERAEDSRTGSVMGLTGTTRRGLSACGDDNNDEGRRSDTVTPTATPAKVLAAEGSPFAAAATASGDASTARAHRRSLSQEDSVVANAEPGMSEPTRPTHIVHHNHSSSSSNAHLQRAMMQLIAQIHTNNAKGQASSSAAAAAVTPQKSGIPNAAFGETGAAATTSTTFKTPETERVPSARPSASKNAQSRNITTIIHTPNTPGSHHGELSATTKTMSTSEVSRYHHSAAEAAATAKGAQRSLASCLESISPQRGESARNSGNAAGAKVVTATSQAPLPLSSPASFTSAEAAGRMPVPRSQRRGAKQGSVNATSAGANVTVACAATASAAESHAPEVQATSYAVVIEGHMQRLVTAVSSTILKRGVCVLFEEDRGIDMGRVVQCDVLDGDEAAGTLATMASATSPLTRKDRPAPVLRLATAEEEYRWLYADVKEAESTLEPCREAAARLGLPVKVVAAVYQFNKAKLTFYYESPTRVDFRPLLPSLFSRFHCRIWMARLETPAAAMTTLGGAEEVEDVHTRLQAEGRALRRS